MRPNRSHRRSPRPLHRSHRRSPRPLHRSHRRSPGHCTTATAAARGHCTASTAAARGHCTTAAAAIGGHCTAAGVTRSWLGGAARFRSRCTGRFASCAQADSQARLRDGRGCERTSRQRNPAMMTQNNPPPQPWREVGRTSRHHNVQLLPCFVMASAAPRIVRMQQCRSPQSDSSKFSQEFGVIGAIRIRTSGTEPDSWGSTLSGGR